MSHPPPGWLLVGALDVEVLPVIAALARRQRLTSRLVVGRLAGVPVAVLRAGVGPERAERRTREALDRVEATRVVSFGTCGSLVDDLRVGAVVTARQVGPWPVPPLAPGLRAVTLATVRDPVRDPAARRRLAATGAEVCEMEAAGVLAAAGGRPFSALKVVSDLAGARRDLALGGRWAILPVWAFKVRALRLVSLGLLPALRRSAAAHGGEARPTPAAASGSDPGSR